MKAHTSFIPASRILLKGCFTLILLFCSQPGFSQKELIAQANKLFDEKKYSEAIPLYNKLYEKKRDRIFLLRLADANYLNENYPQAQKYYVEYFRDSVYEHIPQFTYYANASNVTGKIALAVKLYRKIYEITQDETAKNKYELYTYYLDNLQAAKVYDLDAEYNCVTVDATGSVDSAAAPLFYLWNFDDGKTAEGLRVEHCFAKGGEHKIVLSTRDLMTGTTRTDTTLTIFIDGLPLQFLMPQVGRKYFYIEFDASEAEVAGYNIVDYIWDMDNGEMVHGKKIKFRFNESRSYSIKLTVLAQSKYTTNKEIYSATKKLEIRENYEMPNKKFSDSLNESK